MVEIARALTLNARLIIMDEPSAALLSSEVESLHRVVRELKSRREHYLCHHRLHEVFQLCDRFTVFPGWPLHWLGAVADTTVEQLIRLMGDATWPLTVALPAKRIMKTNPFVWR
jgi:inositol transport system ATP-binding protein